jgi:hypothetical protein
MFGDISELDFGLSIDQLSLVVQETSIEFHLAVTFICQEPMKTAVKMNIKSLNFAINLSKRIRSSIVSGGWQLLL